MSVLSRRDRGRRPSRVRDTRLIAAAFATLGLADGLLTGLYMWFTTGNTFESNPLVARGTNWFFWEVAMGPAGDALGFHQEPWMWTGAFLLALKLLVVGAICYILVRYIEGVRTIPAYRAFLWAFALGGVVITVNNVAAVL